jgi:uncharacterized protein YdeI (YjbR/CyaY-like superfamily)
MAIANTPSLNASIRLMVMARHHAKAMEATFFATPAEFRAWLEEHHESESELLVGFHKRGTGKPSITWPESVDQALCFGWIDGVRRSLGDEAYTIRFTPRKPRSNWSAINVKRMQELIDEGLVRPAGLAAYERRSDDRTAIYSYEQRKNARLPPDYEKQLRASPAASEFFESQPPWYRRTAAHWVISAKREATRERRLAQLIEDSANGRRIGPLTP